MADRKGFKKPIFLLSMLLGAIGCAALGAAWGWLSFAVIFVIAKVGYNSANVFYDAMLPEVAGRDRMDNISSLGYAFGYIGSVIPFVLCLVVVLGNGIIGISMGTAMIAANAVGSTLANFQYMPGGAIGAVMITVVGRCIGAQEKEQAKKYARTLVGATYACLGVVVLGTWIFAEPLIGLYNLSAESTEAAKSLILSHAACAIAIWPLSFTLPNAFRAASDVKFSMKISVFSMWVFRVAAAYLLALDTVSVFGFFSLSGFGLGVLGVWLAMFLDWIFRTALFLWRFVSDRWLAKSGM
jgi:Na+-driven multidrug efflux pump